jgi:hypothetical protein
MTTLDRLLTSYERGTLTRRQLLRVSAARGCAAWR